MPTAADITGLLQDWSAGDEAALTKLTPYVYNELQRLAKSYMRKESPQHTLQPTALVHEAYVRLARSDVDFQNRKHFYVVAARMMRRVLVDHARSKQAGKRGSGIPGVTINDSVMQGDAPIQPMSVLRLDDALSRLAENDPDIARAVELIFFGGLTHEVAADAVGMSRSKLYEDLRFAKAWLKNEMQD